MTAQPPKYTRPVSIKDLNRDLTPRVLRELVEYAAEMFAQEPADFRDSRVSLRYAISHAKRYLDDGISNTV